MLLEEGEKSALYYQFIFHSCPGCLSPIVDEIAPLKDMLLVCRERGVILLFYITPHRRRLTSVPLVGPAA